MLEKIVCTSDFSYHSIFPLYSLRDTAYNFFIVKAGNSTIAYKEGDNNNGANAIFAQNIINGGILSNLLFLEAGLLRKGF